MNTVAIQYIWQAILESERSDDIQLMDDEMLIAATTHGSPQSRPDQSGVVGREAIAKAAISSKLVDIDSL